MHIDFVAEMAGQHTKYFISYARADKDFARQLAERLRANDVDLWLDQFDIATGQRWDTARETALRSCQGVIVALAMGLASGLPIPGRRSCRKQAIRGN